PLAAALALSGNAFSASERSPPIDMSRKAKDRFIATWHYEVVTSQYTATHSDLDAWDDGVWVCGRRIASRAAPAALVRTRASNDGYTICGGQAVVAAGLRDLCPRYNPHFVTNWDRAVLQVQTRLSRAGFPAPEIATGQSVRLVCDFLHAHPGNPP